MKIEHAEYKIGYLAETEDVWAIINNLEKETFNDNTNNQQHIQFLDKIRNRVKVLQIEKSY